MYLHDGSRPGIVKGGASRETSRRFPVRISDGDVLQAVLAGEPRYVVSQYFRQVPEERRQPLLCSICDVHNEIATNCLSIADGANELLSVECPLFIDGKATCLL